MMLGGCDVLEQDSKDPSNDSRLGEVDSCNSLDIRSNTSLSSGVGSSLSADPTLGDPTPDPITVVNDKLVLRASDSSLSSASFPLVPITEVEIIPRKKILPQLTCRLAVVFVYVTIANTVYFVLL